MFRVRWLAAFGILMLLANAAADAWWQVRIHPDHILQAPTADEPLGTDSLGRSVLALLPRSALATLADCTVVFSIAALLGFSAACISLFWLSKWEDRFVAALADGVRSFPSILLAMVFASLHLPVALVLAWIVWVPVWRAARAVLAEHLARPFVLRARACGAGFFRAMGQEALPSAWPAILPSVLGAMAECLSGLAVLEFLGFSRNIGSPGLGTLASQVVFLGGSTWWVWFPATILICMIVAVFALGAVARPAREVS